MEKEKVLPKKEPLSDETIAKLWGDEHSGKTRMVRDFARAIEKAHGIGVDNEDATCVASYDMSIHSNPDAAAWTKFFREKNPDCNVDDQTMFGWFANAMMAMHDVETLERIAANLVVAFINARESVEGDNE